MTMSIVGLKLHIPQQESDDSYNNIIHMLEVIIELNLQEKVEKFDLNLLKKVKNIGLTASASAPEVLVQNFIEFLKMKFDIVINEPKYDVETVSFKIPQQLKTGS